MDGKRLEYSTASRNLPGIGLRSWDKYLNSGSPTWARIKRRQILDGRTQPRDMGVEFCNQVPVIVVGKRAARRIVWKSMATNQGVRGFESCRARQDFKGLQRCEPFSICLGSTPVLRIPYVTGVTPLAIAEWLYATELRSVQLIAKRCTRLRSNVDVQIRAGRSCK